MGSKLDKLTVQGFKSIKSLEDFKLHDLNILIGANGSGKSNFIDVFRMLRAMMELSLPELPSSSLGAFVESQGGIDDLLFNGPKETSIMSLELLFGNNGYRFSLSPTVDDEFYINEEQKF